MRRIGVCALLVLGAVSWIGCSQEAKREASEAVEHTGKAIESAAEDAVNATEGAIEGAKEAIEENRDKPASDDSQ